MATYQTFADLKTAIAHARQLGGASQLNRALTKDQALDILEAAIGARTGALTTDKRDARLKRNILRECGPQAMMIEMGNGDHV